jgi:hypothetical protein
MVYTVVLMCTNDRDRFPVQLSKSKFICSVGTTPSSVCMITQHVNTRSRNCWIRLEGNVFVRDGGGRGENMSQSSRQIHDK